jgi:transcriptional regulator with XRE-family HTH domain
MRELHLKLPDLLHQRQINRKQLADATGIRYSTLSDAYTGKRQPSLGTLEIIMNGVEQLTGRPVELSEVLEAREIQPPDPEVPDPEVPDLKLTDPLLDGGAADLRAMLDQLEAQTAPEELQRWLASFEGQE